MLSVFWGGSLNWPNLYGYNHLCLIGVALAYPQMMIDVMLLSGCLSRLFLLQNPRLSHLLVFLIFFSSLIFFFSSCSFFIFSTYVIFSFWSLLVLFLFPMDHPSFTSASSLLSASGKLWWSGRELFLHLVFSELEVFTST